MNKKSFLLLLASVFSLVGCNQNNDITSTSNNTTPLTTTTSECTTSSPASTLPPSTTPAITKYRLILDFDNNVSISKLEQEYQAGENISFEIISLPVLGTYYSVYFNDSELLANNNIYSFIMPDHDSTLKIEVNKISYDLILIPNEHASITIVNELTSACYNDVVSFKLTIDEGYKLTKVNICPQGTNSSLMYSYENEIYTFIMPTSNIEISVDLKFEYTISINSPYIPVSLADNINAAFEGDEILFSLGESKDKSWILKNVEVLNSSNESIALNLNNGIYSFIMPNDNVVIKVYTSKLYRIIDLSDDYSSLNITPSKDYYTFNSEISFTVSIDNGYELDKVTISREGDNELIDVDYVVNNDVYSFNMPASDVHITVTTKEKVVSSIDPWTSKKTYSGSYNYGDYRCYIYVTFNGDGTLTWNLKYDQWDEWDYDWYGPYDFKKCNGNVPYTFDASTNIVTFTSNQAGSSSQKEFHLNVKFNGETPVSVSFAENLGIDNRAKTKGVILN